MKFIKPDRNVPDMNQEQIEATKQDMSAPDILLTTTDTIPGKEFILLGLVQGNTIQTKNIGRDITQGLRSLAGGELVAYVDMVSKARTLATSRMVDEAKALGADAIVGMRYTSSTVAAGAAEILAFGTAVKFI